MTTIKTEEQYQSYLKEVERLAALDPEVDSVEGVCLIKLADLVEQYEKEQTKVLAMTDLEMTRRCAVAMGYKLVESGPIDHPYILVHEPYGKYEPLHNDAQMAALVKKFRPAISASPKDDSWGVFMFDDRGAGKDRCFEAYNENLNRAVVECVARFVTRNSK